MLGLLDKIIRRPERLKIPDSEQWGRFSYSQEAEDLVLDRFLDGKRNGFYVDVGSHHPFRFSNTYFFYCCGWSGICIDPLPGTAKLFTKFRPRDIVVEMGVSEVESQLNYFMFNEPALNTFDPARAEEIDGLSEYKIIEEKQIDTKPLSDILECYMKTGILIDILNVDVEGMDLQVLKSNDWNKYRPKYVVAECLKSDIMNLMDDNIVSYICDLKYKACAITGRSIIFSDIL